MSKKRSAATHVGIYAFGTIVRQFVGFLMLPIYTRYLSPSDYGIVAMLALLLSVFELVIGARFAQAIPKFYFERTDERDRGTVIGTALSITVASSALGAIIIALASRPLANLFLANVELWHFVAAFGVTLVTTAIENYGLTYIRLRDKPVLFVSVSLAKLAVALTLNVIFVIVLGMGVAGVVISTVATSVIFCVAVGGYTLYGTRGLRIERALVGRLIRFSWPLWLAGGAAVYISFSNRFLLRYFADLSEVGLYDLAVRFGSLITILVWMPFAQWWQTERFDLLSRPDSGQPVYRAVFTVISAGLIFVACGVSLMADTVISVMADEAFHTASRAVAPLAFAAVFQHMALFHNFSFLATERTGYIAYLKYGSAVLLTVAYLLAIPAFGFIGAAYATLAASIVMLFTTVLIASRVFDTTARLRRPLRFALLGAVIVAVDYWLTDGMGIVSGFLVKVLLSAVLFAGTWILLLRDPDTRVELGRLQAAIARKLRISQ